MKAGQVPGMTDIAQVYSDGIHFNDTGMYVVGCTFLSTMYKESPIGLTAAPYSLASGSPLVAIIQTTVWDVVSTHQYAGIIPEILPMSYEVDVPEGGATGIKVRLTDPPAGVTTVHVARIAGDTDISVSGGAELVFTPVDYGTWQTVTLAAGEDADFLHTSATIECSGAGVASCRFEATETDNDASAVCYDPFNATPRVMQDLKTGYGWNGGWAIESGSNGVGYKVVEGNLEYGGLVVKGRKAEGGHSYQGVGRSLDLVSAFLPWVSNMGGSFIGKDGTELWMSYLCRIASTNHNGKMWLDDSNGGLFHDNSGILRVNTVYVPGQGRVWMLSSIAGAFAVTSSVPVTTNVNLMVLRLEFGAEADQIELFANPVALGGDAPAVPDATLVVATNRFKFADMGWNPHNAAAQGWIDEIRFGNSFANVTPLTQQVFTNNNNIVVSGVVENDMRNGYTIIFTGAINGTGTFVTTDGVTNSFVGNVTPGFSPGELAIDRGNGVVNLGLPDDSLMLNIENGDLLVLTNFPGPVDLSAMDVTFYSPTTLGTTNWFLYSTSGFAGEFHDTNYVLYTYGAVIYDGANNRVGVLIVPEPAAALTVAGCALARLTRVRRRRG